MWPLYLMGGKDEANNMATHIIGGSKLCTKNSLQSMSILQICKVGQSVLVSQ